MTKCLLKVKVWDCCPIYVRCFDLSWRTKEKYFIKVLD